MTAKSYHGILSFILIFLQLQLLDARPVGYVAEGHRKTGRRDLLWDGSCSSARLICTQECNGNIAKFDCDPSFLGLDDGSYYCSCGLLGSASSCFSGDGRVQTPSGAKHMKDLEIGDHILTVGPAGDLVFQPIFAFSSWRPAAYTTFIRVKTSQNDTVLVTPSHYMFSVKHGREVHTNVHRWSYVPAGELQIGDFLPVLKDNSVSFAQIQDVSLEYDYGVFMPHTVSGAIVVDDIIASELTTAVPPYFASSKLHQLVLYGTRFFEIVGIELKPIIRILSVWAHGAADAKYDASILTL